MEDFRSYLASHRIVPEKKLAYYLFWVTQFNAFCDKNPSDEVSTSEIDNFLKHLTKRVKIGTLYQVKGIQFSLIREDLQRFPFNN